MQEPPKTGLAFPFFLTPISSHHRPTRHRRRNHAAHPNPRQLDLSRHRRRHPQRLQLHPLPPLHLLPPPLGRPRQPQTSLAHRWRHRRLRSRSRPPRSPLHRPYRILHPVEEPVRVDVAVDVGGDAVAELFGVVVVGGEWDGGGRGG